MRPVSPDIVAFKIQRFMGSAERRQKPAGLTGSLEDMGLVDMIQILSAGGRSIEISLTHGGRQGLVVLKDGDIVHAHCGEAAGEAALYEIMRWESGAFTTRHCAEPPERNIHGSVMSLLMEGSRLADEQRHGMAATG
jgi:hypothetical protein